MVNAKKEFLDHINGRVVKCATINYEEQTFNLCENYSNNEWNMFLSKLNFYYESGYGLQYVNGTIWYIESNKWSERCEYDGAEWWELREIPIIPNFLKTSFRN